jgi:SAM-dependent methyltransferase
MPAYKPDDPCGCNSGRLYRDCHGLIFGPPPLKGVVVGQAIYAEDWAVNAAHYQAQGLYQTLAAELAAASEVHRVLDVGCGLGQGLQAVADAVGGPDRLIIGVDENPNCLAAAAERLQLPAEAVASPRLKLEKLLKDRIGSKPSAAPLTVSGEIVLIQSDMMLPDAALEAWLDQVGPLDAVTLWFSGVHKGRVLTKVAHDIGATSDLDLREALEDQVVELAAKRVRPGGVLQIVQRGAGDMEGERQKWAAIVAGIAADHGFDVVSVSGLPYEEPPVGAGMTLSAMHFDSTRLQRFALSTVLRLKAEA